MGETQTRREIVLGGPLFVPLEPGRRLDLEGIFGRRAPVLLDIGAARARYFLNVAPHIPQVNFLGVEVAKKRVESALAKLEEKGLRHCRMVWGEARALLRDWLPEGGLAAVTILFPDPWPKKRHAKRRIFAQPETAALVAGALAPGGLVLVKTDSIAYYQGIAAAFESGGRFRRTADLSVALEGLAPFSLDRPEETKYEAEFKDEGRAIYCVAFRRTKSP
jgi:tRNA (guanine-N7-)-methyltransferase